MKIIPLLITLTVSALLTSTYLPPNSFAYRASVLPQDASEIDLGKSDSGHLVHLQMLSDANAMHAKITFAENADDMRLKLRIPNQKPENERKFDTLPTLSVVGMSDLATSYYDAPIEVGDDSTAISYLEIGELRIPRSLVDKGDSVEVEITPGSASSRFALLVDVEDDSGRLDDAQKLPRTVMRLRGWYDTTLDDSKVESVPADKLGIREPVVWLPLAITVLTLVIIVWWMISGRSRAKRRGIDRYREHHDS